jgi:uncharacterized protein YmfQ (DUF2313 family)
MDLTELVPQKRYTIDDCLELLRGLLPPGPATSFSIVAYSRIISTGSKFCKSIAAFAEELDRFEDQIVLLLTEMVPGLSTILLSDWETLLGLPDECSPLGATVSERQEIAHAKYTAKYFQGLNLDFYISYAASLGIVITIDKKESGSPFLSGYSRAGDRIGGSDLRSIIIIHLPAGGTKNSLLRCIFGKIKPAHINFRYVED